MCRPRPRVPETTSEQLLDADAISTKGHHANQSTTPHTGQAKAAMADDWDFDFLQPVGLGYTDLADPQQTQKPDQVCTCSTVHRGKPRAAAAS